MDREYPKYPMIGVGGLIVKKGKVLLVKRAKEPGKGLWAVPGGLVHVGENLKDAVVREVMEEAGIKVRVTDKFYVHEVIVRDEKGKVKYHYVILDFLASPLTDEVKPGDDAMDARWFPLRDALKLPLTEGTKLLLAKFTKGSPGSN
ncbi:MAG: hypothetical protein B6U69_02655 [Thermofilum sp. ex4484_15]|nr:MAG: hypothetical protein B6U69_02655 [Thermofilum sp. ex4484_15]